MTVATGLLRDPRAAAELTQDVFVRAYERLRSFDVSRPMKPWLVKIAYRLAQDRWRERAAGREQPLGAHEEGQARSEQGPLEALIADEGGRALWRAVATLPPAERTAAILYYREGLSVDEVAEATGVSAGTVKTLLFRARGRLRALLANKVTG